MGFVVLGIFSLTVIGLDGAVFTMVSHPLTTGALFLVVGMLYERRHTREIARFRRGLEGRADPRRVLPHRDVRRHRAARLLRVHRRVPVAARRVRAPTGPYAIVATFGVILAAVYMLWAFQRAFTGKPEGENTKMQGRDRSARCVVVAPLLGAQPVPRPLPEAGARPDRARRSSARRTTSSARATTAAEAARRSRSRSQDHGRPERGRAEEPTRPGRESPPIGPITRPTSTGSAIAPEIALGGAAVLIVLLRRRCAADAGSDADAASWSRPSGVARRRRMLFWQWVHVQ